MTRHLIPSGRRLSGWRVETSFSKYHVTFCFIFHTFPFRFLLLFLSVLTRLIIISGPNPVTCWSAALTTQPVFKDYMHQHRRIDLLHLLLAISKSEFSVYFYRIWKREFKTAGLPWTMLNFGNDQTHCGMRKRVFVGVCVETSHTKCFPQIWWIAAELFVLQGGLWPGREGEVWRAVQRRERKRQGMVCQIRQRPGECVQMSWLTA